MMLLHHVVSYEQLYHSMALFATVINSIAVAFVLLCIFVYIMYIWEWKTGYRSYGASSLILTCAEAK